MQLKNAFLRITRITVNSILVVLSKKSQNSLKLVNITEIVLTEYIIVNNNSNSLVVSMYLKTVYILRKSFLYLKMIFKT